MEKNNDASFWDADEKLHRSRKHLENTVQAMISKMAIDPEDRFKSVKSRSDSYTEHVEIIMYRHTNGTGRLFGGTLLQMIDTVGAICARRHAGCDVTTVAIEDLSFKAPANLNETLVLTASLMSVGRTSIKVCIQSFVESLDGTRKEINRAFVTFVALDALQQPTLVPRLSDPITDKKKM